MLKNKTIVFIYISLIRIKHNDWLKGVGVNKERKDGQIKRRKIQTTSYNKLFYNKYDCEGAFRRH